MSVKSTTRPQNIAEWVQQGILPTTQVHVTLHIENNLASALQSLPDIALHQQIKAQTEPILKVLSNTI